MVFWLFRNIHLFSDIKKANDLTSFASLVQGYKDSNLEMTESEE